MLRFLLGRFHHKGIGVADDPAILDPDDPVGIFLRQLRIVGDHDHQPVLGYLLQKIHDLHTGVRIQGAGGLVRQQNIRIIHQSPGNSHALHLATGHLVGALMELVAQAHILQGFGCPLPPFAGRNTGNGQCQLHIRQHRLVGDQIIALEHKADGMVSVRIPVPVGILPGGDPIDDQITAVVAVQTADHIQHCGLAGTAGAQNGDKLIVAQGQTYPIQGSLHQIAGNVLFTDVLDLEHTTALS